VKELWSLLQDALASGRSDDLIGFIEKNLTALHDPYEGNPLDDSWRELLEVKDAHQYGDFALTKFYNPADDIGLGQTWESVEELLDRETGKGPSLILGSPLGPTNNYFDPGKMGSYFQSEADVHRNLELIKELLKRKPELSDRLHETLMMLTQAVDARKGLYVPF
jgi:hypothetical protein